MSKRFSVSDDQKKDFAAIFLLEKMINKGHKFPLWLEGNDKDLEQVLEYMMMKDLAAVDGEHYKPTAKGKSKLQKFMGRYVDFLRNFDVYCAVDLTEGEFAFREWFEYEEESAWDDYLCEEHWEDLRVAVAEYKGIDPVEIVYMSFLNEGRFGEDDEGWQFDLLLGSIWDDILEICNSALKVDDLGYEEDGDVVSGEDVIRDIIGQGVELNHWIKEEESSGDDDGDDDPDRFGYAPRSRVGRVVVDSYDGYSDQYRDPKYVSSVWKD